jgi:hypothetical protein
MLIRQLVRSCDYKNIKYPFPVQGAAYLAQGATGRWCEVMHMGPEILAKAIENGHELLTYDQAVAKVAELGGYVDF